MNPISSDLGARISALKKAGEELRQATTTNAKVDAILKFGTELDSVRPLEQEQLKFWPRIRSFRPWEEVIDVLTEAPELTDDKQHECEVVLRFLCAVSAGKLVSACETYLRDHSATAYLSARLPKILQHQAWLSINTRQWKSALHSMRQTTLHLIRLVLLYEKQSANTHEKARRLDRDMYLSLIFSHVLDPHTYREKRGEEYLADVVEVLMALSFDNQPSKRAASWAATEFGPSLVCTGFLKFSQSILESKREPYFLAPLVLATHLLASEDNHSSMVDQEHVAPFCINFYWSMVKQYNTIGGMAITRFSSMIAKFIYAVLGVVGDPRRRAALMHDLIKEADFVNLLGHMWLHSWGSDNDALIAALAKQTVTLAAQDLAVTQEYIKPAWLHVQKYQWSAYFGRHLGWTATSDASLLRNDPREDKLVGCAVGAQRYNIAVPRVRKRIGLSAIMGKEVSSPPLVSAG
ncbi:hypothetical protein FS837_006028 [Tulasnella sp. UAMH 9824]|nr:hypothetical protein FS837_006028 [Tulasnella sp. UAMH 9824]